MSDGLTIAIPNWNHELLLPRSIASALECAVILRNAGVSAEVLVLDDNSRDGSLALLRQLEALYYDHGLRVLARKKRGGLSNARNQLLESSRQKYILFMDADNEMNPAAVPLFRQTLIETGAAAAYGNLLVRRIAAEGPAAYRVISNESIQARIFAENYIDAFAVFDRRQLLDVNGYVSEDLPLWEDHEMWLHLATNGRRLVFVPLVLGYYNVVPHSMLRTADSAAILEQRKRMKRAFDQIGQRASMPLVTERLRYFPGVGYL